MKRAAVLLMSCVLLLGCSGDKKADNKSRSLDKNAVSFAVNVINQDIVSALSGRGSLVGKKDAMSLLGIDVDTTTSEYERAFKNNEVAANEAFYGKRIKASGKISEFSTSLAGSPVIQFGTQGFSFGVSATFSRKYNKSISGLRKGEQVSIVCEGARKSLSANLDDCEMLADFVSDNSKIKKLVESSAKEDLPTTEIGKAAKVVYILGKYAPTECATGSLSDAELGKCFKLIEKAPMSDEDKAQGKALTAGK